MRKMTIRNLSKFPHSITYLENVFTFLPRFSIKYLRYWTRMKYFHNKQNGTVQNQNEIHNFNFKKLFVFEYGVPYKVLTRHGTNFVHFA